ncbi:MAG: hypothetical protein H7Z73_04095, partial [Candidatus Saccharibacteria bacterium]|nr:hypothetical protein [Moraxellaceae bacterium]
MKKKSYLRMLLLGSSLVMGSVLGSTVAQAAMSQLDDLALSSVEGQADTGVNIALSLQINQSTPGVSNCGSGVGQTPLVNCRLGFQFNSVANWLLLKGFNGTINVPQLTLFGADLGDPVVNAGAAIKQSAIGINFNFPAPNTPSNGTIQFKNLNFILGLSVNSVQYTTSTAPTAATTTSRRWA